MIKNMLNKCPICDNQLVVSRLTCHNCHTKIESDFTLHPIFKLSQNELEFITNFILVQGNIKDMERIYEVSYPTIKKNLENIISKLGGKIEIIKDNNLDSDLLEQIRNKKITVDEAIKIMKGKK